MASDLNQMRIRLDDRLKQRLEARAAVERRTMNNLILLALERYLNEAETAPGAPPVRKP